ncbi:MAG: hypothetical protein ACXVFQ_01570 [Solirubrobacteraceae bacterium]
MGVSDSGTAEQGQSTGLEPFPLNRVVAFLGPFVAIISGAVATWLIEHIPGLHIDKATLASNITAAIVFLVGAAGTFVMHLKWLTGWQAWEQSLTDVTHIATPDLMPSGPYDPTEFDAAPVGPSEEFAPGGAGVDPFATQPANDDLPTPPPDTGTGQMADQTGDQGILPDADQELQSVPDAVGGTSASQPPETAAKPDPPTDEIEPQTTNGELPPPATDQMADLTGDAGILPDGEQELGSVPDAVDGTSASLLPETAAKPDPATDEIQPAVI